MLQHDLSSKAAKAQALIRAGDYPGAKVIYEKICKDGNSGAESWMTLGAIHGQLGDGERAVECLQKAIALRHDFPEAHYNLGYVLRGMHRQAEAAEQFEQAVKLKPDYFEAWVVLGAVKSELRDYAAGEACFRKAVELQPGSPDAYANLGNSLLHQDHAAAAEEALTRALQLRPGNPQVLLSLGYACQMGGKHELAVQYWQQTMRYLPDSYEACLGIGKSFGALGKPDEAWTYCEKASKLHPNPVGAIVEMAVIADVRNDIEKAYELLLPLINDGVSSIRAALVFARACHERGNLQEGLVHVERALAGNPRLNAAASRRINFDLGKIYDAAKQYDRAFEFYKQANAAKQWSFDADRHRAEMDDFIAFHSPERMAGLRRSTITSNRPIFIVGMMRSGTTLMEQILSSHHDVHGASELPDIVNMANTMPAMLDSALPYPDCLTQITQQKLDEFARSYLDHLSSLSSDAARVVDKAPVNFRHLGFIEMMFPEAHVIHCMRDPRDSCLSNYFHDFLHSHDYTYDLANLGSFYRDYRRLMRHWRAVLKMPLLEVQYEEMVANPDEMIRKIIDFCGLEWDENCMSFYKTRRHVNTPSYDQVRQPMYRKSAGRWRNYENHLGPLIEALGDEIKD